jgi:UDP-glucose 4-epimerase
VDRVDYVARDLERERIDDLVAGAGTVVYAAAVTPRGETTPDIADRLLAVNLEGYLALLRSACHSARCRRVIFVSSSAVYGPSRHGAITEDDVDADGSLYSAAKLAAELIGRSYAREHGRELCAVRPTSLIGPGETERPSRPRVTPFAHMVRAARDGTPVRLVRGESRGDWLAVDDAAEAVALLCAAPRLDADTFNLSSGVARPFAELADAARRVAGLRIEDDAELVVDGGNDLPATVSNARVGAAVGWRPSRSPDDIVRELLAAPDERG